MISLELWVTLITLSPYEDMDVHRNLATARVTSLTCLLVDLGGFSGSYIPSYYNFIAVGNDLPCRHRIGK